jgi:hypothetical protein
MNMNVKQFDVPSNEFLGVMLNGTWTVSFPQLDSADRGRILSVKIGAFYTDIVSWCKQLAFIQSFAVQATEIHKKATHWPKSAVDSCHNAVILDTAQRCKSMKPGQWILS